MATKQSSILKNPANNFEVIQLEDGRVAIAFDPSKKLGLSASGKSQKIASTSGNLAVLDFTIGFNAYRKA